ncbi:hypothetical protein [Geodermatophilus marinus]|uniref:hypothetical protein n=1 Tax=Geodermatophilus sp. LHW52908 TaxID=2303986 RepID=UPI000E3C7C96|nr:hypothetical protein [Geodermatophilus sp. LHW52908]RFU20569.1 hypothetical protein D0Z06_15890 [Geodermatophilus sp. LHW52908]
MTDVLAIEPQGEHQFVVRMSRREETAESWSNLSPGILDDLGVREDDEEVLVRRTVAYLLEHQDVADFPDVVELEDVVATYADYLDVIRSATSR